jgi:hypothetical protein
MRRQARDEEGEGRRTDVVGVTTTAEPLQVREVVMRDVRKGCGGGYLTWALMLGVVVMTGALL